MGVCMPSFTGVLSRAHSAAQSPYRGYVHHTAAAVADTAKRGYVDENRADPCSAHVRPTRRSMCSESQAQSGLWSGGGG
ncbi:hypothetical protein PYCCODRAFT_214183 [Trametes coccinea BRFM310]|uniref:Uncharacterized protein n=1 Tax=Trametes coccinea (strain BRFM310) TaxID=1353009 RepID=A0A1Y2IQQ5_TRAC3|nr:hypothetical protein PYCCODRAFT_214183 [Trametes coccinea BRFM310]